MTFDNRIQVPCLLRMVWSFVVLFMLSYTQIIPVSAVPPDLASELTVEAITTTGAKVKWDQTPVGTPATFDSYEVSITPSAGITFTPGPLITANSTNPETTIAGLTAGDEYTVSVCTVKGTEKGTEKSKKFNAKPNPLSDISAISFKDVASTTATVSWSAPTGTFAEYVVSVSPAGATFPSSPIDVGTTSAALSTLTPGTVYTVEVKTKSGESLSDGVTKTFTTKPVAVTDTSIIITALTADSATLTWDPVTTGTFVEYTISVSGGGVTLNPTTVPKGAPTTIPLTNLTPGTSYTVTLKTRAVGNVESDPATHTFTTKPEKVDASTLTVGNTATTTKATLTWGAVTTQFQTYEIAISPTKGGAKANPASVAKESPTTTALESLTPGTLYTITIKTKSATLESDAVTMTFRTKPQPVDQSKISVSATTNTAKVEWEQVTTGSFDNYSISVDPTATITPASVASTVQAPSVDLSGLSPGIEYTLTLKTVSGGEESTPATKTFRTKPLQVSNVGITNLATTTATITWTPLTLDASDTAIYKYKVEIVPTGTTVSSSEVQHPGASTGVIGMTPGTKYTVKVTTIAGAGTPSVAMSDIAELEFNAKPTPVTQNTIVFENVATRTATAKWGKVSVGVITGYKVSISPTGPNIATNPVLGTTDPPTTALANLVPGTQYTLTVITVSGDTDSSPSSATFTAKPLPVTGVTLTQNVDKMSIAWTAGVGSTQSSYKVRYRAIFQTPTSTGTEETEATSPKEISITPGEKYEVQVIAISGDQSSDATPANLVTAPLPPATVSVTNSAATTTSIEVTWTIPSSASYFIKYIIKYTKVGATTPSQVEATPTERTKTIPGLEAGVQYSLEIFTETKEGKRSTTSTNTVGTAKPNCDVVVTDLSTETNKLKASFTTSTLVFTEYKFVILNGPIPASKTLPKGTTPTELVYDQGVQPGNKYTLKASCVSNGVESDATDYFLASVPAPVTKVEHTPKSYSVHMTIYRPAGTVSYVEVSCSGHFAQSSNAENVCEYSKSVFFSGNTYNLTYDKLDSDETYNFTFKVISNLKKSAPYFVIVKTLEGRPGPPSGFTVSAMSPTSVKLEWKTPTDPNGVITTYVVEYTGVYKANSALTIPHDKDKVPFAGLDPNAGGYIKTLDDLKGGFEYVFVLYGMTSFDGAGENAAYPITMPTAAPALAVGAKPPQKTEMENRTVITAVFTKAFDWSNGPILYYSVIAAENNDDTPLPDKIEPDDTILTWTQVKGLAVWQPYMAIRHCDIFDTTKNCEGSPAVSRRKRSTGGDSVEVTIGIQDCTNKGTSDYCNGALKAGTSYQLRLRGYTGKNKYHDTPYSQRIPTTAPDQTGMIVGVVVGLLILLMIGAGVGIFFFIKYRKAADRIDKYGETGTPQSPADTKDRSRPVRLADFPGHHAFMHADTDFRFAEEYEDLKDVGTHQPYDASELPHNRVKNRFTNILPYDWSRVKLSPLDDEEGSDYINANYIPGFTSKREYIACQGPLVSTKDDFWRMIWEQNCQAIVMLTRCVENGREKCSHYWPEDTDPVTYGDIEVVILNETQTQDYSITQLRVTKGEEVRRICHYHFMAWPDFSAPDVSGPLLRFLRIFREREGFDSSRPMCVHCSAGVGRSGTFITLDRLTQHMKQHDYVDIYGTVYEMRMHRRYMVQTEQQYIFIHRAILDIINDTVKPSAPSSPAIGRENPAFEDIPLNDVTTDDSKIADDEGITLEVLS